MRESQGSWNLAVAIGADELPFEVQQSEPLIVPGIAATEVVFMVQPDSDTLAVTPPRASLRVVRRRSTEASFQLAPLTETEEHHVWLNVLQDTELVQVIPITLSG